jgi:hypothetical protein
LVAEVLQRLRVLLPPAEFDRIIDPPLASSPRVGSDEKSSRVRDESKRFRAVCFESKSILFPSDTVAALLDDKVHWRPLLSLPLRCVYVIAVCAVDRCGARQQPIRGSALALADILDACGVGGTVTHSTSR